MSQKLIKETEDRMRFLGLRVGGVSWGDEAMNCSKEELAEELCSSINRIMDGEVKSSKFDDSYLVKDK